jgi:chorismate mutase
MTDLDQLREIIDAINEEIISLFAERLSCAKRIALLKKEKQSPIHDSEREKKQMQDIRKAAEARGIRPEIMEKIFGIYIDYTKEEMQ